MRLSREHLHMVVSDPRAAAKPAAAPAARVGLRTVLLALAFAAALPGLAFGVAAGWTLAAGFRAATEDDLRTTARIASLALDRELRGALAVLTTLAASPALDGPAPDLAGFEAQARAAAKALGGRLLLARAADDRRPLLDTASRPSRGGEAAPPPPDAIALPADAAVFATGRAGLTDLLPDAAGAGAGWSRPAVTLAVPVRRDGALRYALHMPLDPARFSALLAGQPLTGQALATLLDASGRPLAHSRETVAEAARPAPAWLAAQAAAQPETREVLRGPAAAGGAGEVAVAYARPRLAPDWILAVTRPLEQQREVLRRPLLPLLAGGLVALGLGAGLAFSLARELRRPIAELAAGAAAAGVAPSAIAELEALRHALRHGERAARLQASAQARAAAAEAEAAANARSEALFRAFAEASPDALWILDAEAGRLAFVSPAHERIWGETREALAEDPALRWGTLVHPEDRERVAAALPVVLRGEALTLEYRVVRATDRETRWVRDLVFPLRDGTGRVRRVGGIARDITEHRQAGDTQRLLINELNHRVKNTLATVQSIADQTLRSTPEPAEFATGFRQRLLALARAHDLLNRESWGSADLADVCRTALAPWLDGRVALAGAAPLRLAPHQAVPLCLALHELATNAAKHGALSVPQGRVRLSWRAEAGGGMTAIDWVESGGPPVRPPTRRGFGSRLLGRPVAAQLGGTVELRLDDPAGARCAIRFPPAPPSAGIAALPALRSAAAPAVAIAAAG